MLSKKKRQKINRIFIILGLIGLLLSALLPLTYAL